MLTAKIELILGAWRSATIPKVVVTIAANETITPSLLRIDGSALVDTRESHSHIVVSAEEKLASNRARKLASHTPNLEPSTETSDDAVNTALDVMLPIKLCKGKNAKEATNAVTVLFSTVTANF